MKKILLFSLAVFTSGLLSAQYYNNGVVSVAKEFHDIPPIRDMAPAPVPWVGDEINPRRDVKINHDNQANALPKGNDPLWQKTDGTRIMRAPIQNWEGMNQNQAGGASPPDPSGAAGPNHYVEMVNTTWQVFDKLGNALSTPQALSQLFPGSQNSGDPIVMYDEAADRWFVSQFQTGNNDVLIAISKTPDPLGGWWQYSFGFTALPDYLKFSIWSDGYYMTSNSAASAVVFERDKMLIGDQTARQQQFTIPSMATNGFSSALSTDYDGTPPPVGAPCVFAYFQDDSWGGVTQDALKVWEFHTDWVTTGNTNISLVKTLPLSPFNSNLGTGFDSFSQPGTAQRLDGIEGAMMYRLQYRNMGGHQSIVGNFTVDVTGNQQGGIRWFELRDTGTGWSLYQEGTFSPDSQSRFMGSISMDAQGNIGLGYSVVGSSTKAQLRYTGRMASDPLGQMTVAEQTIFNGNGIATNINRFGDYSQLTIDPNDGLTFWFVGEYFKSNNSWTTRIASFKLGSAFTLDASVSGVSSPSGSICTASVTPSVTLSNLGTTTLTSATINYDVDGGTNNTFAWTGSLTTGQTATITLPTITPTAGAHTFNASVSTPNGGTDLNTLNDASSSSFTIITTGVALPFIEGFEGTTFLPTGWTLNNPDADTTWIRQTGVFKTGSASARIGNADYNAKNQYDEMVLPAVDLSSKASPTLTFELAYKLWTDPNSTTFDLSDTLEVLISTDCGATFTTVYKKWKVALTTTTPTFQNSTWRPASAADWRMETIDLSTYSTASNAIIVFRNINDFQNTLFIDDINIDGATVNCNLTASTISSTNENCNGSNTGIIVAAGATGTTPYTYNLGAGSQSTGTFNSLTAGSYNVTVTDAAGCTATTTTVITEPTALTVSSGTPTNVLCNGGSNGAVTVTATGGTAAYNFNIGNGNQANGNFVNLTAGTYTVTTTDANACITTIGLTITQPTGLVGALSSQTNISCTSASSGAATVTATGGTAAYNFNIGNGNQTNGNFVNLTAGIYTVTITDANACTTTTGFTLTTPPAIAASVSNTAMVSCNAGANGSVTVSATGGSGNYSYNMGNGSQTSSTFSNLGAGVISITVTDGSGCSATTSATITQPTAIAVTGTVTSNYNTANISCNGTADGEVTILATGGTGAYTGTGILSGQAAGTNNYVVTDANGCTGNVNVTLVAPAALLATGVSTNATCGVNDGSINTTISGGTGITTYNWNNGAFTTQNITNVGAGVYNLVITDANGCTGSYNGSVSNVGNPTLTLSSTAVSCNAGGNGTATGVASGGVVPYNYTWSPAPGVGQGTANASSMAAGVYSLNVSDNVGCIEIQFVTVTEPATISIIGTVTDASCGANNGVITTTFSGGNGGNTFNWNSSTFSTQNISSLASGLYNLVVTDNKGCTASYSGTVNNTASTLTASATATNITCNGNATGTATAVASLGAAPYSYTWSPIPGSGQSTANASAMTAGNYSVTVTDNSGCTATTSVNITEPTAIAVTGLVTNVNCGNAAGAINVTATGGTPNYSYDWNNGTFSIKDLSNVAAGSYSLIITDSKGCTGTYSATIGSTGGLTMQVASTNVSCAGNADGNAAATVTTGTAPFTYTWSPTPVFGQGTVSATMGVGVYTVSVSDLSGCSQTASVTITEPVPLMITGTTVNTTCGSSNGGVAVIVSGGTTGYSYSWNVGTFTTQNLTNMPAGNYSLAVTDNNSCVANYSADIVDANGASLSAASSNATCYGSATGSASISTAGGTQPFSFEWSSGQIINSVVGLNAGNYSVTVTDANGCTSTDAVIITQPSLISIAPLVSDAIIGGDGAIDISVIGGVTPYTYDWDNDGTGDNDDPQDLINLNVGTYTVVVIDANGCTASMTTNVNGTTSIETNGSVFNFEMYPNPNIGEFNLKFENLVTKHMEVNIVDVNGKLIFTRGYSNVSGYFISTINITEAASGTYFMKISTDDRIVTKRIVKQ